MCVACHGACLSGSAYALAGLCYATNGVRTSTALIDLSRDLLEEIAYGLAVISTHF